MARVTSWVALTILIVCASGARAQEASGELAAAESSASSAPAYVRPASYRTEEKGKRYYYLGAGWRFAALTTGLLKAYTLKAEDNLFTPKAFFAEAGFRRDGFQVGVNLGLVNWKFQEVFRLKDDPVEDAEWMNGKFNFVVATTSLTWSTAFRDWFQLEYGLEAGLAFIAGRMVRNEAVREDGKWRKCDTWASQGPFENPDDRFPNPNPNRTQQLYCDPPISSVPNNEDQPAASDAGDEVGAHYGAKSPRGLFNEGIPYVVPVLAPRLSLRFKPVRQLVVRVDVPLPSLPFGLMGGVALQYQL
jgi:hypothetical protein